MLKSFDNSLVERIALAILLLSIAALIAAMVFYSGEVRTAVARVERSAESSRAVARLAGIMALEMNALGLWLTDNARYDELVDVNIARSVPLFDVLQQDSYCAEPAYTLRRHIDKCCYLMARVNARRRKVWAAALGPGPADRELLKDCDTLVHVWLDRLTTASERSLMEANLALNKKLTAALLALGLPLVTGVAGGLVWAKRCRRIAPAPEPEEGA